MIYKSYTDWLKTDAEDCGICAPPMDAQLGINFLKDYLLSNFKSENNREIVLKILCKYSWRFRVQCLVDKFNKSSATVNSISDDAQDCIDNIYYYLLGSNWYVVMPLNKKQINTEIVCEVLDTHSWKFRREIREYLSKN